MGTGTHVWGCDKLWWNGVGCCMRSTWSRDLIDLGEGVSHAWAGGTYVGVERQVWGDMEWGTVVWGVVGMAVVVRDMGWGW